MTEKSFSISKQTKLVSSLLASVIVVSPASLHDSTIVTVIGRTVDFRSIFSLGHVGNGRVGSECTFLGHQIGGFGSLETDWSNRSFPVQLLTHAVPRAVSIPLHKIPILYKVCWCGYYARTVCALSRTAGEV